MGAGNQTGEGGGRGEKGPPEPMQRVDIPSGKRGDRIGGGHCRRACLQGGGGRAPGGAAPRWRGAGGGDLGFAPNPQNPPVLRSSPGQSGKAAVIDSCQSPRAWQHRPQGSHPKRARCFSPFQGKREGRMGIEAGDAACTSQHSPGAARRSGVPARLWERLVGVSPHLSTVPKPA